MPVGELAQLPRWLAHGAKLAPLALALTGGACREQKTVATTQVGQVMAENAYQPFSLKDGCEAAADYSGHCTTEHVLESSVTSGNQAVFEVLSASEGPANLGLSDSGWLLHSVRAGSSKLSLRAKFDDGTDRKATVDLTVRRATRMQLSASCQDGEPGVIRLPVGQRKLLEVTLFDGEQALSGLVLSALKGDGIEFEPSPAAATTLFAWSPTAAGDVAVTSDAVGKVPTRLSAVSDEQITVASLAPAGTAPYAVPLGQVTTALAKQVSNGAALCEGATLMLRTESPGICSGPDGEAEWEGTDPAIVVFKPLVAGTCRLSAGTRTGPRRTFDIPLVAR